MNLRKRIAPASRFREQPRRRGTHPGFPATLLLAAVVGPSTAAVQWEPFQALPAPSDNATYVFFELQGQLGAFSTEADAARLWYGTNGVSARVVFQEQGIPSSWLISSWGWRPRVTSVARLKPGPEGGERVFAATSGGVHELQLAEGQLSFTAFYEWNWDVSGQLLSAGSNLLWWVSSFGSGSGPHAWSPETGFASVHFSDITFKDQKLVHNATGETFGWYDLRGNMVWAGASPPPVLFMTTGISFDGGTTTQPYRDDTGKELRPKSIRTYGNDVLFVDADEARLYRATAAGKPFHSLELPLRNPTTLYLADNGLLIAGSSEGLYSADLSTDVVPPVRTRVRFLGEDRSTSGDVTGVYGSELAYYPGEAARITDAALWEWPVSADDPRALRAKDGNGRRAPVLYHDVGFTYEPPIPAGTGEKVLTLYFADLDTNLRHQEVSLRPLDGGPSVSVDLADFSGGVHLRFGVTGPVRVSVLNRPGSPNAILNGAFVDPVSAYLGEDRTTGGEWPGRYGTTGHALPAVNRLAIGDAYTWGWAFSDLDLRTLRIPGGPGRTSEVWWHPDRIVIPMPIDRPTRVALYFLDFDRAQRRARITWTPRGATAGQARELAHFENGLWVCYEITGPGEFLVENLPGSPNCILSGIFTDAPEPKWLGEDRTTGGQWLGVLGGAGVILPGEAGVALVQGDRWEWPTASDDRRALQSRSGLDAERIAPCWWSPGKLTLRVAIPDGTKRHLHVYCVDFDGERRAQRVTLRSLATGARVSRDIESFTGGVHLGFEVEGAVEIEAENLNPSANAVISALFLDSVPPSP